MKFENALVIALIILIFVVIGAYVLINGNGTPDDQLQDSTVNLNPDTDSVNTDVSSSGQSSGSVSEDNAASDGDSSSDSGGSQDNSADAVSPDGSTPQAGQAEGTYDPADFD